MERIDYDAPTINGAPNPLLAISGLEEWFPPGWCGSPAEAEERYLLYMADSDNESPIEFNWYSENFGMETLTSAIEGWLKHSGRM